MKTKFVTFICVLIFTSLLSFTNISCKNVDIPKIQLLKTSLEITVRNSLGNTEEGTSVQIFETEEDYNNEENPVGGKQITDEKGRVKFSDLKPMIYYIYATKDDMSNFNAGIKTDTLQEKRMNKVTVIID